MNESKLLLEADDLLDQIFVNETPEILIKRTMTKNYIVIEEAMLKDRKLFLTTMLKEAVERAGEMGKMKIIDYIVAVQMDTLMSENVARMVNEKSEKSMEISGRV